MDFCSEGVVWTPPFTLSNMDASAEESDLALLQAVYGASYEPMPALDEEDRVDQWIH